jgi:hypothetical protein
MSLAAGSKVGLPAKFVLGPTWTVKLHAVKREVDRLAFDEPAL